MPIPRYLRPALVVPMILAGLVASAPVCPGGPAPGASAAPAPAPVQLLDLTTQSGRSTEIARSGLDGARSSRAPAAASDAVNALTAAAGDVGPEGAPDSGADAVDPERDAVILTDPLKVDDFLVAGFTWTGGEGDAPPDGVRIYLRVRENGSWSPWYLSEAADSGRDDRATPGTGEFVTGGADAIQASVVGSSLPAGLKLALVPSRPQGEEVLGADDLKTTEAAPTPVIEDASATDNQGTQVDPAAMTLSSSPAPVAQPAAASVASPATAPATVPVVAPAATTANGLPVAVTTRAEWGANASYMSWDPEYARAGHVVVHHTAGTNSYSAGQSASIVRGIYYYHAVVLDWGDIGYNFLVDKFGTVFEGRSGSVAAPAGRMSIGAHARGVNTGTMGISMMGDYSTVSPSDAQLSSVGKMAGWFLKRAGISDVTGWAGLHVWTTERYQAGSTISMPRILGHRDVGYSKLGTIRAIAKAQGSSPQGGSSGASSTVPQDHPGAVALRSALGANGWIGAATSGVQASTKGGVFQSFEHGVGYWSPATGAQFVGEPVLSAWGGYGYQTGSMGYPRSGGVVGVGGSRHQIFEGGIAYWRPGGRVGFIHGSILNAWAAAGWERSKVGLPTGRAVRQADGTTTQTFEKGSISVAPNGKVTIR